MVIWIWRHFWIKLTLSRIDACEFFSHKTTQAKQQFSTLHFAHSIRSTFGIDCGRFLMFLLQPLQSFTMHSLFLALMTTCTFALCRTAFFARVYIGLQWCGRRMTVQTFSIRNTIIANGSCASFSITCDACVLSRKIRKEEKNNSISWFKWNSKLISSYLASALDAFLFAVRW